MRIKTVKNIGHKLRILRDIEDLTQEEASKGIGIQLKTLRRYEKHNVGQGQISIWTKIAKFYGLSLDELYTLAMDVAVSRE